MHTLSTHTQQDHAQAGHKTQTGPYRLALLPTPPRFAALDSSRRSRCAARIACCAMVRDGAQWWVAGGSTQVKVPQGQEPKAAAALCVVVVRTSDGYRAIFRRISFIILLEVLERGVPPYAYDYTLETYMLDQHLHCTSCIPCRVLIVCVWGPSACL